MQRALELIQKHLDEIATPAELGRLLAQDPAVRPSPRPRASTPF
jgi:hypothetical protein